jgi:hypothetical protein
MGTKNDTAKPVTTEIPASASIIKKPEAASPAVIIAIEKPAVKKKPAKKAVKKKLAKLSTEDIALRAYFISEHRHKHGIHGDSHSDWVQAEKQLKAELKKAAAKKAPAAKKKS